MAGKKQLQKIIALYRIKSGETELDPKKIAEFALRNGVEMPQPKSPLELLAREISVAAREDLRRDEKTKGRIGPITPCRLNMQMGKSLLYSSILRMQQGLKCIGHLPSGASKWSVMRSISLTMPTGGTRKTLIWSQSKWRSTSHLT